MVLSILFVFYWKAIIIIIIKTIIPLAIDGYEMIIASSALRAWFATYIHHAHGIIQC